MNLSISETTLQLSLYCISDNSCLNYIIKLNDTSKANVMTVVTEDHEYCYIIISKACIFVETLWCNKREKNSLNSEFVCQCLRIKDILFYLIKKLVVTAFIYLLVCILCISTVFPDIIEIDLNSSL